jgi:hypothetical protein
MSFGKMEGDASDKGVAYMLQQDEADGPYYHQEWEGMPETTPIISGGVNALRLPAFYGLSQHGGRSQSSCSRATSTCGSRGQSSRVAAVAELADVAWLQ